MFHAELAVRMKKKKKNVIVWVKGLKIFYWLF